MWQRTYSPIAKSFFSWIKQSQDNSINFNCSSCKAWHCNLSLTSRSSSLQVFSKIDCHRLSQWIFTYLRSVETVPVAIYEGTPPNLCMQSGNFVFESENKHYLHQICKRLSRWSLALPKNRKAPKLTDCHKWIHMFHI